MTGNRNKWLMVGVLIGLLLAVAGGIFVLMLLSGRISTGQDVPDFASASSIESRYPDLIRKMKAMAAQGGVYGLSAEEQRLLVTPTEILEARIGKKGGYAVIGKKVLDFKRQFFVFPRIPHNGEAVVNKYWYTLRDGTELVVVRYEVNVGGTLAEVNFDLEALREK